MRIYIAHNKPGYPWRPAMQGDTWIWVDRPEELSERQRDALILLMHPSRWRIAEDVYEALQRLFRGAYSEHVLRRMAMGAADELTSELVLEDKANPRIQARTTILPCDLHCRCLRPLAVLRRTR
jgi:hypothetical protein